MPWRASSPARPEARGGGGAGAEALDELLEAGGGRRVLRGPVAVAAGVGGPLEHRHVDLDDAHLMGGLGLVLVGLAELAHDPAALGTTVEAALPVVEAAGIG